MPRVLGSNFLMAGLAALAIGLASTAAAAQPVVQPIPGPESRALSSALSRLAANPGDEGALVAAGNAALGVNDVDAAIGFFKRAEEIAPRYAPAKAGLASAHLRRGDPFTAIRLFEEAERLGGLPRAALSDRGLAYDLVGDNATAQRFYREVGPGDEEVVQRLALSLAISGDKRGSEAVLSPLINRQDKAAWRTRAFALAILGEEAQAVSIANATMPPAMASGIAPYLRYMGQLTPAQQAAAANLGQFPRASEIGRDDPRVTRHSPPAAARPLASADSGLVPAGRPLGPSVAAATPARTSAPAARPTRQERQARQREERLARQSRQARPAERERPPEPVVGVSTAPPPPTALAAAAPRPAPVAARPAAAAPAAAPGFGPTLAQRAPASPAPPAGPSFSLTPATASAPRITETAAPASAPRPAAPAAPPRPRQLADAFGDLGQPVVSVTPAPGAVDIRRITPARPPAPPKPEPKAAKPAPPAQPSRIWVQVATGRDKDALAFDWRRMSRGAAAVFRGKKPHVAGWGQTNRLLTGPFESEAAANAFIAQLRPTEVDGAFLWTSPAGQVVDELAAK